MTEQTEDEHADDAKERPRGKACMHCGAIEHMFLDATLCFVCSKPYDPDAPLIED